MIYDSAGARSGRRSLFRTPLLVLALMAGLFGAACDTPDPVSVDEPNRSEQAIETPAPAVAPALAIELGEPYCEEGSYPVDGVDVKYQICWPAVWNGRFIAYGHGYVSEFQPLDIPQEADSLAEFVGTQGFAFASTSYRTNGLAIREGAEDMAALAEIVRETASARFPQLTEVPVVLASGASEGGAIVTLAAETYADVFQGALSTCGPTGNFMRQLKYLGDFNVLFNYFFPQVFADGSGGFLVTPADVAPEIILQIQALGEETFALQVAAAVTGAVAANPAAAQELLKVARVAYDPTAAPDETGSGLSAILGLLRYNVLATNDAIAKLGGSPYDNRWTSYRGSSNDWRLNSRWAGVERYTGDSGARSVVAQHYETDGELEMPYVSLHTTGDDIVEFVQQPTYRLKALFSGSAEEHSALPIFRYGHCEFEEGDLVVGLALLMLKVGASSPAALAAAMPSAGAARTFRELLDREWK
ncbi:MAG TPA: hypothetical protein VLA09_10165 [Longimicrobiales bacterium]|nr:hypothetical protein [Longimicrobiales bacterium]